MMKHLHDDDTSDDDDDDDDNDEVNPQILYTT